MVQNSKVNKFFNAFFVISFLFVLNSCGNRIKVNPQKNIETGYYYLQAKEYSLALKYFLEAKKRENNFIVNYLIAYTLYKQKNYKDALKFLDEALKLDKSNSKALILKGDIYFDQKNYKEALKYYKKVLENKDYPNFYLAYYKIGKVYLAQKKIKEAKKYFLKSYYNNPYFIPAQKELVKLYLEEGKIDLAEKFLKNLLSLAPNDKEVQELQDKLQILKNSQPNFIVF